MSELLAASGAALALYYLIKQRTAVGACGVAPGAPVQQQMEACRNVERPPNTWFEALLYFKEVFKYMYSETLGRWHTVDLFVGLAYLAHRESPSYAAADLAAASSPISMNLPAHESKELMSELHEARRYMLYCRGLKHKRPEMQRRFWVENLGIDPSQIIMQQATAGLMRPAYVVSRDEDLKAIVLCIRGTQSMKDLFTSLTGATKPHHVVVQGCDGGQQVVLGYAHLGMLASARWIMRQVVPVLRQALQDAGPGYVLRIVGHSMGGGAAVMLTMQLRNMAPEFADARCVAIACPACMTHELAVAVSPFVTSVINGTDIVPTFCSATVESLREDVTASSWFAEFQGDLRNSVVAALRGGWRGVGSAGSWTARNILSPAAVPFRSCYSAGRGMRRALTGPVEVAGGEEEGDGEGRSCMLPAMPKSDRRAFDRGPMEDGDLGRPLLGEEGSLGGLDQEEATTSVPGHVGVGVGAKTARRTSLSLRGWIPGSEGGGGLRGGPVAASAPDLSAASKAGMQGRSSISYQQGQGVIAEEGSGMRHWYGHDNDALPPPHLPLSESVMEEALRSCLYAAADSEEGALSRMGLGLGGRSPRRGAPSPQPRPGAPGHHRHRGSSTPGDGIAEAEAEAVRELDPQAGVQAALQLLGDAGPQHRRNGSRGGRPRAQQHQQPAQGVDSTEGSGQGSLQQAVKRRLWPWGWGAALGKPALGQAGDLQGQGEPVQGGGGDGSTGGDVPQRGSGWGWWRAGAGGDMGHSSSSPSSSAPLIPPNGPALPTSTSAHDHEGDLSTAVGAQGPGVAQRAAQTAGSWLLGNMFNSCAAPRRHGAGASGAAGPGSDVQRRPASSRPPSHTDSYGDVFMLADNGAGASIIMGGGGGYVPPKAPLHADSSTGPRRGGRDRELSSDGTREEEDGDEEDGENDTELVGMDLAGGASLPEGDPTGVAGAASRAAMHQQLQAGITAVVAAVTREGNSREQAGEESGADETMGAAGHAAYMDVDGEGPHHAHPQPSGQGKGWWFPSRTQQTKHGVDGGAAAAQHPRDDGIARETALPSTNAPGSVGMAREADGSGGGAAPHRTHSCASGAAAGAAGAGGVRSPTSIVPKRLYPAGRILHFFPVHDLEGPAAAAAEAAAAAAGGAQVSGTGTAGHHASHTASHTQAHAREPEAPQAQAQAQQSEVEAGAAASRAEAASHTGAPSESGEADAQAQTAVPSEEVGAPAPAPAPASPAGATVAVGLGPAPCAQPGPANIAGAIASMAKAGATATTGNTDAAVRAAVASAAPGADGLLPATVQPAPGQRWVLHRADNHRAYGRLKLCRTMVMDHFVFSYLQALDSVVEQLQASAEQAPTEQA